jgi:threonine aldolase
MSSRNEQPEMRPRLADLRSDLMTGCTGAVANAMDRATRRPPAMMRNEDPDEHALTRMMAEMLGTGASLFLPTCTMANQVALRLWCGPGQAVLAEPGAHLVTKERQATALAAVVVLHGAGERGHLTPDTVLSAVTDQLAPRLVWLEDTHMRAGGTAMPAGWTEAAAAACRARGVGLHLDGSRLANAAVARGESLARAASGAATVSISLNKALGAPLGAILAGPRDLMDQAAEWREMLGGNWRPIGPIAAAARAALPGWEERLARDHALAADLARRMQSELGEAVGMPDTNIILVRCPAGEADRLVLAVAERGVGVLAIAPDTIRLVMHAGIAPSLIPVVAEAVAQVVAEAFASACTQSPGPTNDG